MPLLVALLSKQQRLGEIRKSLGYLSLLPALSFLRYVNKNEEAWLYVVGSLIVGWIVVPVIFAGISWFLEFQFIKSTFVVLLSFLDQNAGGAGGVSSSVRKGAIAKYGTYKALYILFNERPLVSWGIIITCLLLHRLLLPPVLVAYVLWVRFFSHSSLSSLEKHILAAYDGAKPVELLLQVESMKGLGSILEKIISALAHHYQNSSGLRKRA